MEAIADILPPRDADGILHIGRPARGCRHCGKTEVHYSSDGKVAWHHPGVTCCRKAIEDQISYRRGDLARLRQAALESQEALDDLRKRAETGFGKEASELRGQVAKAERAHDMRLARLRAERDAVNAEIAEAEQQLAAHRVAA
jgi:hypothetical protein